MFDRNVRGKTTQTECLFELNLGSFGYFECTTALWLLLEPSCKGNLLTRVTQHFRARRSPDPKNRAFEKNGSCIQILDTILYMDSINQLFCMFCMSLTPCLAVSVQHCMNEFQLKNRHTNTLAKNIKNNLH